MQAQPNISKSPKKSNPADFAAIDEAGACGSLVDVILEIGRERHQIMAAMRAALLREDDADTLQHARELTGLPRKNAVVLKEGRTVERR